jgi:hypothetical protein
MIVGYGLQKIVDFVHVSEALINVTKAILNMIQMYFHAVQMGLYPVEAVLHGIKSFLNTIESLVCCVETFTDCVNLSSMSILNFHYGLMNLIEDVLDTSKTRIVDHATVPLMA